MGVGWYFKYGNYRHGDAECWFNEERQTVLSPEKIPMYDTVRWDIHGFLQRDTAALLKTAEIAMMKAYMDNGNDAGFYLASGTATAHVVKSKDTRSGVRVSRRPYFPESRGAEGVLWRNYSLSLEWEESTNDEKDVLLSWEQSIRVIGTGGPDWDIVPGVVGDPIIMPKTEGSKVTVIQSGRAVGLGFYPKPPTPVWNKEPPLHGPSAMTERFIVPGPARERVAVWSYTFMFPSYLPLIPTPTDKNFHL